MTLADKLERVLLERGALPECALAVAVGRRKADVSATLKSEPRFVHTGKRKASRWDVKSRGFDAAEAATLWKCDVETAQEIIFGPEGFLERGFVASLNGNGRVVVTECGLAMARTLEGAA